MKRVRTVSGDIPPEALGITAPHEHLYCDQRVCRSGVDFPSQRPLVLRDTEQAVKELKAFLAAGGQALAEVTVRGWGRDVAMLEEISKRSGVHIIATSGFYVEDCHPEFVREADREALVSFLLQELAQGADGTTIRTGLLKIGLSRPVIEGQEKKCAQAVAQAQKLTGVAITTHSPAACRFEVAGGNLGTLLLDFFEQEEIDPCRIIIGHSDSNPDLRQLAALARRGAYIEFDLIGRSARLLDETRVALLCQLVEQGYEKHLLLSADICRAEDWKVNGGRGYDIVLRRFVPRLREAGFDEALLRQILVDNPARALCIELNDSTEKRLFKHGDTEDTEKNQHLS